MASVNQEISELKISETNSATSFPALLQLAGAVRSELEAALGHIFTLWRYDAAWQPVAADGSSQPGEFPCSIQERLSAIRFQERCGLIDLAEGRHLLAVPVRLDSEEPILLVAPVADQLAPLARALADSVLRACDLNARLESTTHQLDSCIFQITASFEELTWLRSLTEHFEICSLENGLASAAHGSLPSLRQLIYAQELFLFGMPGREDSGGASDDELPLLAFDGAGDICESVARELIRSVGGATPRQSIVWNAPHCGAYCSAAGEIRNYILTPVLKCQDQHGWLLAVNKNMPLEAFDCIESDDRNLVEFGTTEASLLGTLAVMLATHGNNVELIREKESLLVGVIRALVNTIDAKDAYTCGHSDRVASMAKRVAEQLGHSPAESQQAYMAGLLHDIGKIGVPDSVLGKASGLTDEEYALIKMHPEIGAEILKHLKPFSFVLPGVLHHHETFDGSGYPGGLAGEQIPLLGRIIAVVDSYDAMTSNRTYRKGMPTEKAEGILRGGVGTQWDGRIVEAFMSALPDIHAICGIGSEGTASCVGASAIAARVAGEQVLSASC